VPDDEIPRFWRQLMGAYQAMDRDRPEGSATVIEVAILTGETIVALVASYDVASRWVRLEVFEPFEADIPSRIVAIPEHALARIEVRHVTAPSAPRHTGFTIVSE
jgi:hypothetical protein